MFLKMPISLKSMIKYVLGTLRKARVPNFKKVNRIVGIPTRTSAAKAK
ncbi:hypothetical protein [Ureibacillus acetophenoni]